MGDKTGIEWTDATWNPVAGCSIVSKGCTNCYAMKMAARIEAMGNVPHYAGLTQPSKGGPVWTGKMAVAPDHILTQPLRWKKPRKIFVNSMSDLFHEAVPDEVIDRVFAVMALAPQHTFQVLTKRPERMRAYMLEQWQPAPAQSLIVGGEPFDIPAETTGETRRNQVQRECEPLLREFKLDDTENPALWDENETIKTMQWAWPLPNVWLGVSVEDQATADQRIPLLLDTPAAVRFISAEPLLGPVDLTAIRPGEANRVFGFDVVDALRGIHTRVPMQHPAPRREPSTGLHWVIVGGESGPGARPMHPDWARDLRDQCAAAGVAFLFKQWGEWAPGENATRAVTRTEQTATYFGPEWSGITGWSFGHVTRRDSEEMHRDDEPDVWRLGKKQAGRLLDGVEHNGYPEAGRE